jgi:hypothetical protein
MDILKEIAVALVTSTVISSILVWFIKQYFEKRLNYEFHMRESVFQKRIEHSNKIETQILDTKIGIYPELMELVYRLSVIMRDGITQDSAFKWGGDMRPLCAQLTEDLFKYRFFLDNELFDILHRFKHIAQDATLLVDIHTRPDKAFNKEEYDMDVQTFIKKQKEAEKLVEEVQRILKERIEIIQKV